MLSEFFWAFPKPPHNPIRQMRLQSPLQRQHAERVEESQLRGLELAAAQEAAESARDAVAREIGGYAEEIRVLSEEKQRAEEWHADELKAAQEAATAAASSAVEAVRVEMVRGAEAAAAAEREEHAHQIAMMRAEMAAQLQEQRLALEERARKEVHQAEIAAREALSEEGSRAAEAEAAAKAAVEAAKAEVAAIENMALSELRRLGGSASAPGSARRSIGSPASASKTVSPRTPERVSLAERATARRTPPSEGRSRGSRSEPPRRILTPSSSPTRRAS